MHSLCLCSVHLILISAQLIYEAYICTVYIYLAYTQHSLQRHILFIFYPTYTLHSLHIHILYLTQFIGYSFTFCLFHSSRYVTFSPMFCNKTFPWNISPQINCALEMAGCSLHYQLMLPGSWQLTLGIFISNPVQTDLRRWSPAPCHV